MEAPTNIFKEKPPLWLQSLLKRFPRAGVYLVGGMVRDMLLGRPSNDYDFVVRGVTAKTLEKFLRDYGLVNLVGKNFGVFKFTPKGQTQHDAVDIALPRTEHSLGLTGGYRDFDVQSDHRLPIAQDLQRRDFTVNAMAFDLRKKRIIDPCGGLSDLAAKRLRTVGQPELRFQEDYSRLLRAIRFAVQLGFEIEYNTWKTLKLMAGFVRSPRLPREMAGREFLKTLEANPLQAIDLLDVSGVLRVLAPEALHMKGCAQSPGYHSEGDVWDHSRLAVEALFSRDFRKQFPKAGVSVELILAAWWHDIGKPYTKTLHGNGHSFYGHEEVGARLIADICRRLRLSSYDGLINTERISWLARNHLVITFTPPHQISPTRLEETFLTHSAGQELLQLIFADQWASRQENGNLSIRNFYETVEVLREIRKAGYGSGRRPKILLTGNDIMARLGLAPGPRIGEILHRVRLAQLQKKIRTSSQAIEYLSRNYGQKTQSRKRRRTA
ncbi:MAG: CCA tRNA nucleotidyltransferase [bacterium]|nr:CCA tRNA nucleotidyltransferase [bacterium]